MVRDCQVKIAAGSKVRADHGNGILPRSDCRLGKEIGRSCWNKTRRRQAGRKLRKIDREAFANEEGCGLAIFAAQQDPPPCLYCVQSVRECERSARQRREESGFAASESDQRRYERADADRSFAYQ